MKLKTMFEDYSIILNKDLHKLRKYEKQFSDICAIINYDITSNSEEKIEKIHRIIFSINYKREVLSLIKE